MVRTIVRGAASAELTTDKAACCEPANEEAAVWEIRMVALDVSGNCGSMIAIGLPDPCELPVVGVHANHN